MYHDPIVEEVHRIREQIRDECGGNLDRPIESLGASEAPHRDRIISPEQLEQRRRKGRPAAVDAGQS